MKNYQCGKTKPHLAHTWRDDWFFMFRKLFCAGVPARTEAEAWNAANPNLGYAVSDSFWNNPPVHKHRLKLTGWSWSGLSTSDILGAGTKLQFTCLDECKKPDGTPWKYEIKRRAYDELVLNRPELKQYTWHT